MASAYLELIELSSHQEICEHWRRNGSLDGMFEAKKIDISGFKVQGISFGRPSRMGFGVYQLMVEIYHLHRGTWCTCSTRQNCRNSPETRFSFESMADYGLLNLNPWERWSMINMWEEVFNQPAFDPRDMLAARRSADSGALQMYVGSLVDIKKYFNKYKTHVLFPNLWSHRIDWERSSIPSCFCISH